MDPRSDPVRLLADTAWLRRLAFRLTADADLADDLHQEVALAALRTPRAADGGRSWLAAVARNLAAGMRRRRAAALRREAALPFPELARSAADLAAEAELQQRAVAEVLALPAVYRETVLRRFLQQSSVAATAAAMGVPEETVRARQRRALALLRARLAPPRRDRPAHVLALLGGIVVTKGKMALAAAAVLVAGWLAFTVMDRSEPEPTQEDTVAAAPFVAAAEGMPEPPPALREPIAPPGAAARGAVAASPRPDDVVVLALDDASGEPIESFGLRASAAPDQDILAPEVPLRHAGRHPGGRLLLRDPDFAGRVWLLETGDERYVPSRWFSAADLVPRDGVRTVEVRLPRAVEVDLRVVREHGGAPVAGTKVELVRPWPATSEVTLRTVVTPTAKFRGRVDDPPLVVNMLGGQAMLLSGGITDAEGNVRLLAPPGERLALRLLGPGHRPSVRAPWIVDPSRSGAPVERLETVTTGAAIRGRVVPAGALAALRRELPEPGPGVPADTIAQYVTGLRVVHREAKEVVPAQQGLVPTAAPLAADGSFVLDGLHAGDWQVFFCHPVKVQELAIDAPVTAHPINRLVGLAPVEVELPPLLGLQDHEVRVFDVDVSALVPGDLEATVTIDGAAPGEGMVIAVRLDPPGVGRPILRATPNLRPDAAGRLRATLPPARYGAWWSGPRGETLPLQVFEVRSGETTNVDFTVRTTAAAFRIVEADGVTPAHGRLLLRLAGPVQWWVTQAVTDASGTASFPALPRGLALQAGFQREPPPPTPGSTPATIAPVGRRVGREVDLGPVPDLVQASQPIVLRLPPQ